MISFTVDGTTFSAEEGMTWGEWVASVYNTDGYIVDVESDDEIVSSDGRTVDSISLGGSFVYADDVIISGKSYYLGV